MDIKNSIINKSWFERLARLSKKIGLKKIATVGLLATGMSALVIYHNKPVERSFDYDINSMKSFEQQYEEQKDVDITVFQDEDDVLREFNEACEIYDKFINDDNEALSEYARVKMVKAGFDLEKMVKKQSKKKIDNREQISYRQLDLDYVITFDSNRQNISSKDMPTEVSNIIKLCFEMENYNGSGENKEAWMKKDALGKTAIQKFKDDAVRLYNKYLEMKENEYHIEDGKIIKEEMKKSY